MSALALVFQYRTLQNKCEVGLGLSLDEIDLLAEIEGLFTPGWDDAGSDGRRHRRETVTTRAILRGRRLNEQVTVTELAPGGLVCADAPEASIGEVVELVFDDHLVGVTYRFKAQVSWVRPDPDAAEARMGLAFVGAPVCIHWGAEVTPPSPMFERIRTHAA